MFVPVKSKEANSLGVFVPIPTRTGFVAPPKIIAFAEEVVAPLPIAIELVAFTTALYPIAILLVASIALGVGPVGELSITSLDCAPYPITMAPLF